MGESEDKEKAKGIGKLFGDAVTAIAYVIIKWPLISGAVIAAVSAYFGFNTGAGVLTFAHSGKLSAHVDSMDVRDIRWHRDDSLWKEKILTAIKGIPGGKAAVKTIPKPSKLGAVKPPQILGEGDILVADTLKDSFASQKTNRREF